jgi:hypothetical protein
MLLCSNALFVALASIFTLLPAKAAVLTLSCNGTMKAEERWSRFPGQNGGLAKVVSGFDYAASFSCSLSIA